MNSNLSDYAMPRPSTYLPNCDNLAALLGSSIDDSLLRAPPLPIYSYVKPEPFETYQETSFAQPSIPSDYTSFCPTSSYTSMTAMAPSLTASSTSPGRDSPLLPVCPLPTEKTIDSVFYTPKQSAVLCSCADSLQDPSLLIDVLNKGDKSRDVFHYCKTVADENVNVTISWAKRAPYFDKLPVCFLIFHLCFL